MSIISKLLNTKVKHIECDRFLHPGMSCTESVLRDLYRNIPDCARFFLPFALIPLVVKIKRLNKDLLKDHLRYFLEIFSGGYLIGFSVTTWICILRNVLGRFSYYTMAFWPSFLAGCWAPVLSSRAIRVFSLSLTQIVIEAQIRERNCFSRHLSDSLLLQTCVFMICSGVITQTLRHHRFSAVWFVKPTPAPKRGSYENGSNGVEIKNGYDTSIMNGYHHDEKPKRLCAHKGPCQHFITEGIKSYFFIGLALETVKTLMAITGKSRSSISSYLGHKFRTLNFGSLTFFVSFIAIYRSSLCFLNNNFLKDPERNHLLSSVLAGLSYVFIPKITILSYAMAVSTEISWKLVKKRQNKNPKLMQKILNFPMDRLFIPFALGYVVHMYIHHNHLVNSLGAQVVNRTTNNKAYHGLLRINEYLKTVKVQ